MNRETRVLFLILVAIAINRLCSLLPSGVYFDPFPLYDLVYNGEIVGINLQAYCYAITVHLSIIIMLFAFREALPQLSTVFLLLIGIEFLSLADFFIIYEQRLFYLGKYPVEFTDFKILSYAIVILLWKDGKL
jgi:hypothetical protein